MEITRTSEPRLEQLANSVVLKLVGNIVLIIGPPLILWALSTILARLDKLENSINDSNVGKATTELRLKAIEDMRASDRLLKLEFEVDQLKRAK